MNGVDDYFEDDYFEDCFIENTTNDRNEHEDDYVSEDYNYLFMTDEVFPTRDAAREWVDAVSFENKMAFFIASSNFDVTTLRCERAGNPRTYNKAEGTTSSSSSSSSRKSSGSKKRGCSFRILLKQRGVNEWIVQVTDGLGRHNHPNAYYREGHTIHARFKKPEIENVKKFMNIPGMQLKGVMKMTKDAFPKNVTSKKGFENLVAKLRREGMGGKSKMEALIDLLNEHNYHYKIDAKPGTNKLGCLVLAPPETLNLIRLNPGVIIMDATYKTNNANLPLVEIIGIVSTGKNFHLAFAFIHNERTDTYLFVMQWLKSLFELCNAEGPRVIVTDRELASMKALRQVFPEAAHLLCRRHIKMDCQNYLAKSERTTKYELTFRARWDAIVFAPTEDAYEVAVASLKHSFRNHPNFLIYLDNTWLIPYRDRFVSAWTRKYMHYGTETTNRVESAHFQYKKMLGSTNNGLVTCVQRLMVMVTFQHNEIKKEFEFSRTVKHPNCKFFLFHLLANKVSRKAIDIMQNELASCDDSSYCTCELRDTHGLPCACEMMHLASTNQPIRLEKIDMFWKTLHMEGDVVHVNKDDARDIFRDAAMLYAEKANEMELMMQANLLYQRMHPETCVLDEPDMVKPKGRPKNAIGSRIPCNWERQEKELKDAARKEKAGSKQIPSTEKPTYEEIPKTKEKKTKKQNPKRRTNSTFDKTVYPLVEILPRFVDDFLDDWFDVEANGNCGYNVLAEFMYGGQQNQCVVRTDIYNELISDPRYQMMITEMAGDFMMVLRKVQTDGQWLDFLYIGLAAATKLQVIINVHSEPYNCISYWPLNWNGSLEYAPREINVGHVRINPKEIRCRRNHFIGLKVKDGAPMPLVNFWWTRLSDPTLHIWLAHFATRQQQWVTMLGPRPSTTTTIISSDEDV